MLEAENYSTIFEICILIPDIFLFILIQDDVQVKYCVNLFSFLVLMC